MESTTNLDAAGVIYKNYIQMFVNNCTISFISIAPNWIMVWKSKLFLKELIITY